MKILVHNYSSETSTEPLYIAKCLEENGHETKMWSNKQSAFDVFDEFNPQVFITHYLMLTHDIIKRLVGENIKVLINVSGATQQHLDVIGKKDNLNIYLFQNYDLLEGINVVGPCADTYSGKNYAGTFPLFVTESLFIIEDVKDLNSIKPLFADMETYHVISLSRDLVKLKEVDAYVPVAAMSALYQNYDEVFVTKMSQAFFDAAHYRGGCRLVQDGEKSVFLENQVVKSHHFPYNRVKALLEQIGDAK